jgi:hypothetical protein
MTRDMGMIVQAELDNFCQAIQLDSKRQVETKTQQFVRIHHNSESQSRQQVHFEHQQVALAAPDFPSFHAISVARRTPRRLARVAITL